MRAPPPALFVALDSLKIIWDPAIALLGIVIPNSAATQLALAAQKRSEGSAACLDLGVHNQQIPHPKAGFGMTILKRD
jgi:hypothetical protein